MHYNTLHATTNHWPACVSVRTICFLIILLLCCAVTTACGILTESSVDSFISRTDRPDDFNQFLAQNGAHKDFNDLHHYLASYGVHNVIPAWQLLQQGSDWKSHSLPKYAMPPKAQWEGMANTLIFLKWDLIPYIGPVRVLSGFRTTNYNQLAGGASQSRHLLFSALDLRPVSEIERSQLHGILQNRWSTVGKKYNLGLGLYNNTRFHIDTGGYRQW